MVQNVTGSGTRISLTASVTYPQGITLTQFADDTDPLAFESAAIAEAVMGANGDLISFSKYAVFPVTLGVIPGGDDDGNMAVLFDANRIGRNRTPAGDVLTMAVVYPDGRTITLSEGVITEADPGDTWQSAGRLKTKPYKMTFGALDRS